MEDLETIDQEILETIEALSVIPGVSSHRGVHPEEVREKLELSDRDYVARVDHLKRRGLLEVSTGWVAVLSQNGRRVLQDNGKSQIKVIGNDLSVCGTIWEYISNEYKNSPVKTFASTLAIIIIISGFAFSFFNDYISETSPPVISTPKSNPVTNDKIVHMKMNVSDHNHNDDFSTNLDKWILFGSPPPQLLLSAEGRNGVFDNNGDGNCDSGVVSRDALSLPKGFTLESDVFLRVTNPAGCWNDAFIGLTKDNSPAVNSLCAIPQSLLFRIYYSGDACWQTPADKMRHAYLDGGFYTESGAWESIGDYSNADAYINGWHKLKIVVGEDRHVKFYVDDIQIYSSRNKIDPAMLEGKKIYIGGRSSDSAGKVYHDYIKLISTQ